MADHNVNKKKIEQNDPKGATLKFVKPDLMCGGAHQISIYQPSVVIDSHMHIMSGRCAPIKFVQSLTLLTKKMSRKGIEKLGIRSGYLLETMGVAYRMAEFFFVPEVGAARTSSDLIKNDGKLPLKSDLRKKTEQSMGTTLEIADDFMKKERKNAIENHLKNESLYKGLANLLQINIVMPMDMEYAHVDGYYGLKIYNALYKTIDDITALNPCAYWTPVHGKWVEVTDSYVDDAGNSGEVKYSRFKEIKSRDEKQYKKTKTTGLPVRTELYDKFDKDGVIVGSYTDTKTKRIMRVEVAAVPVIMSSDELEKYEYWEKQLYFTKLAVLKYPLKFLPLFHYDPRRWQSSPTGNDIPLSMVAGKELFLGFKIYTPQGYRPMDARLPVLEGFYAKCCDAGFPIMNHCTPEGASSYEKKDYFNFKHYNDTTADQAQKDSTPTSYKDKLTGGLMEKKNEDYFEDYFVSPEAWKKQVLDKTVILKDKKGSKKVHLNTLRLCLAHFGGPTSKGMKWNEQIIKMILDEIPTKNSNVKIYKYPNLYTDISSSFCDSGFRKHFQKIITAKGNERLKDRILFGTDWYMTLQYGMVPPKGLNFEEYCRVTKKCLDEVDTSLWPKFTQYNPYEFYRLDTEIERIAKNIIDKRADKKIRRMLPELLENEITMINLEAAWIKVANIGHNI